MLRDFGKQVPTAHAHALTMTGHSDVQPPSKLPFSARSMFSFLLSVLWVAYLASIPILLLAILYALKTGLNEVIKGLQAIADQGARDSHYVQGGKFNG